MNIFKKLKITGLAFGLIFIMSSASAALLVEPHLGYNLGTSGDGESYSGGQFGMRLGYQQLGLMAGLDFTRSSFDQNTIAGAVTTTNKYERNEWGLFVGYNLPILIRAWGAYYFSNTTKNTIDNSELTGNTKELGVGFTPLPLLSINFMYRMIDLNKNETAAGVKTAVDNSAQEYVVGISLPLTL